jgi:hypothetical protein
MQATIQIGAHLADRRLNANARPFAQSSAAWFRLAVVYLLVGAVLGVAIGASENFELRSVHSHVSLLGWTTVALAELIYRAFPEAGASRLARVHFWLYNLALPPMIGSLAVLLLGYPGAVPILAGSQVLVAAGLLAFVANVFLNVRQPLDG